MIKNIQKGYTGINVDGATTFETDALTGVSLAADRTLTVEECKVGIIEVSTGHATNSIIVPTACAVPHKLYIVYNADAALAAQIKVAGGTAVSIAATKTAIVRVNAAGTQVLRVTADS